MRLQPPQKQEIAVSAPSYAIRFVATSSFFRRRSAMLISVPREIKVHEYRVGLVPAGVRELVAAGHEVLVETHAGEGVGLLDLQYEAAGAKVVRSAAEVFRSADLIVKVKEPQLEECRMLRHGQMLF